MSDFSLTPDLISAYTQKYGIPPSAGAMTIFNRENAAYSATGNGTGSVAGAGIPAAGSYSMFSDALTGAENGISAGVSQLLNPLGALSSAAGTIKNATGLTLPGQGVLDFFSDIPRLITVVIGVVLLVVGLAALGAKPALSIIQRAGAEGIVP